MRPLHFVSRKTGHPLVRGFEKDDFRLWYSEKDEAKEVLFEFFEALNSGDPYFQFPQPYDSFRSPLDFDRRNGVIY